MDQLNKLLITEMKREAESTRKLLSCVPEGRNDWKPHERSFALGRLAAHVAELPHWANRVLENDEFDMAAHNLPRVVCESNKELLELFETKLSNAIAALEKTSDEKLAEQWVFRRGDFIIAKGSRYEHIRHMMGNHQVHHRGQLSVYLRLLDIPIPGMYGPSADDMIKMQQQQAATAK